VGAVSHRLAAMAAPAAAAAAAVEVRQAILDGVGRIFDISPECFDQQAPSAFGIFRWSIEKAKESPGINLDDIISDLPEKQAEKRRVLQFLVEYHDKKKLYRKQVDLLLCSLMQSPSWRSAGIDGSFSKLSAKLQERIAVSGQAAGSSQGSLTGPPGPPSTGGSTDSIVPQGLEMLRDLKWQPNRSDVGEVGGRDAHEDGQVGLNSPMSSRTLPDFNQDEISTERFRVMEDYVRYLSGISNQMRQELNVVKKSVDTLKTTVLGKIEVAIQEILECHDAHAKDHVSITERLEYLEKTAHVAHGGVDVARDGTGDNFTPLAARIDCLEAAISDNNANQAKELGTMLSQLESLAQSARDSSVASNLQANLDKEKVLRDGELAALHRRLDNSMQETLASERAARESFQQELQQWMEGVEKKVSARDRAARDFKQLLLARRTPADADADVPEDIADAELDLPVPPVFTIFPERTPVPPSMMSGPPRRTPPHSPPMPPREIDAQPHPVAAALRSPGDADRRIYTQNHAGPLGPPVATVMRQASQTNRVQFSPPPVNRSSQGSFTVPAGGSPLQTRGGTRTFVGNLQGSFTVAAGHQDARYSMHGSCHMSPGVGGSYHVSPGGSGTYPVAKMFFPTST